MKLTLEQLDTLEKILDWELKYLNIDIKRSGNDHIVEESIKQKKLISPIRLRVRQQIKREQARLNLNK